MPTEPGPRALQIVLSILLCVGPCRADMIVSQGTNITADVSGVDGRLAIDLLGSIWIVPADGGLAEMLSDNMLPAKRPRWSPDGSRIVYQTQNAGTGQIWTINVDGGNASKISDGRFSDRDPAWHPDGERIVFSSARRSSGFDIWETDLPTGLSWRISSYDGDETEPAWSADGRSLTYIRQYQGRWSLMLQAHGQPARVILDSDEPLHAPSWRPDGTLITFLRRRDGDLVIEMAILSDPPLVRSLIAGEDLFVSPVSWPDRSRFFYTSDGLIKTRDLDDWVSEPVRFSAVVGQAKVRSARPARKKALPISDPPDEKIVIRAARLFDGTGSNYRRDVDVLIDGPRVAAVKNRQEWPEATVLDLGDVTLLPGFIDSYSSVSAKNQETHGAELLSYGVTTLITNDRLPQYDPLLWEGGDVPGPRLLWAGDLAQGQPQDDRHLQFVTVPSAGLSDTDRRSAVSAWQARGIPVLAESWSIGLGVGADLLLGVDSLPSSPKGIHYQDVRAASANAPVALVSGLADAGTPGLAALFDSRQAGLLTDRVPTLRRFSSVPRFVGGAPSIMLGSKPSGLPPGLALHAEMRALAAAGLSGDEVLRATTGNPARVLGLDGQIGQITEGALADMVLVGGDPLVRVADALNIVAVVRNGRFYSLISLLERARSERRVE